MNIRIKRNLQKVALVVTMVLLGVLLIFLAMRVLPILEDALVERAPVMNLYVEFESLDNIGTIISRIKTQHAQVLDVEIDHGRSEHSQNPSAVFSLQLGDRRPHTRVLIALAGLDCVYAIEEF